MKKNKFYIYIFVFSLVFLFNVSTIFAETYDNFDPNGLKSCGGTLDKIPPMIPQTISIIYTIIQIAVPIVLVIVGSLDLLKGITAQKEDEIKKGQQILIKRLISAAIVFFVFSIVKFVVGLAADDSKILDCAECFIKNSCD